jgi:membrane protein implicated in regulation of membrane protease activity
MLELYWGCFIGGALFVLVTIIFGDMISGALDGVFDFMSADGAGVFNPLTIVGGITVFGGMGILLIEYTSLNTAYIFILSLLAAVLLSILLYFFYVKPMEQSENSTGYSIEDLAGHIGEVSVTIPSAGYGEVILQVSAGIVNQIASSYEQKEIPLGAKVVVVEVKDHTLQVVPFNSDETTLGG